MSGIAGAGSAALSAAVMRAERRGRLPGGGSRWVRRNHRGDEVTLVEGLALGGGVAAPLVLLDPPVAAAVLLAGAAGAVDDLGAGGQADVKGLRGHLGALRRGELTTGALKIAVLGAAGTVVAVAGDRHTSSGTAAARVATAGLVAGGANLANLLDLRPGRALKAGLLVAAPLAGRPPAAAVLGATLALLPEDLRGRTMLGDTGANALGAALGAAAARALPPAGRWGALAAVTALTLASERVSFTRVIESTPVLRELDAWGRR
ncbi:hypothetical protein SGUI_0168 [Serinicoccus hydrothermalis]|uniref:Uncharacterized protein n=1 Tax=Serinicoccus hydrothermalis TaxID=1758689 RepID=A0A1B1N822_9MICO|nr:hypothetical protein [Serinicoccus hydrothermalis]ANS77564.1 hypothetical protein SGUI_0168 [Serinicoccus hydrothermalis]